MRTVRVALMALLLAASSTQAATLAGVTLPDKVEANGEPLVLNGLGLRSKFIIKVYVGGLYLPQKESSAQKILAADTPRRMVLHFIYDVSEDQMCEAWHEGLKTNTPGAPAEVVKSFQSLCAWMAGVGKGQELVLTYLPGRGTRVEIAGTAKGTLPGKPTADAILSTWIGANPAPGKSFKKAILGG